MGKKIFLVVNESCTILKCTYTSRKMFDNKYWINLEGKVTLYNLNNFLDELPLLYAFNIPFSPSRHYFNGEDDTLYFNLYFPPLPNNWEKFALFVNDEDNNNIYYYKDLNRNTSGVYNANLICFTDKYYDY